ncbi:MAG TPA: hypothetical protein PLD37_08765, partial [Usitatibacteraceae bacterium]|nr:hypothetical protein [Usitatibacteraceae bacterium]
MRSALFPAQDRRRIAKGSAGPFASLPGAPCEMPPRLQREGNGNPYRRLPLFPSAFVAGTSSDF